MRSGAQGASAIIALLHPPKLVRVPRRRVRDRPTSRRGRRPVRAAALGRRVMTDRIHDLVADPEHRVQGRHRVLEDHREALPAEPPQLRLRERHKVDAVKDDRAANNPAVRRQKAEHRVAETGLSGSRFTHDPHRLAAAHVENRQRRAPGPTWKHHGHLEQRQPPPRAAGAAFPWTGALHASGRRDSHARHAVADRCKPVTTSRSRGRADDDRCGRKLPGVQDLTPARLVRIARPRKRRYGIRHLVEFA